MPNLNIILNQTEYRRMKKAKDLECTKHDLSWREFILRKCVKGLSVKL